MKKCKKCNIEKPLEDFHKMKGMSDGLHSSCKACVKKSDKERYEKNKINPDWIEKEKIRCREKYQRLPKTYVRDKLKKKQSFDSYNERYPEKEKARNATRWMKVSSGHHNHHWSYLEEFRKDVIQFSIQEHNMLHRFIIYDQERMMYRRIDTMELLDTKQKHLDYYNSLEV